MGGHSRTSTTSCARRTIRPMTWQPACGREILARRIALRQSCGPVTSPLARAARLVGFKVRVIDNDAAFANQTRFPEADTTLVMAFDRVGEAFDFGPDDYVVLMTRGHQHDQQILAQIYACQACYLGMLGSKRRITAMWQALEAQGMERHYLERINAPIGLDIRARSAPEISVSILAEIIQARRTDPVELLPRRPRRRDEQRIATAVLASARTACTSS
jgi:xanthine/CO dehydrogenase XdhC/CoxF family maturation factor